MNNGKIEVKDYTEDKYKEVYPEKEGMRLVKSHEDLYGFVNVQTKAEQIPCQYNYAKSFSEGKALVRNDCFNARGALRNYEYKYINSENVTVVGRLNVTAADSYHDGLAKAEYGVGQFYMDEYGNELEMSRLYKYVSNFSEGLAVVTPFDEDYLEHHSYNELFDTKKAVAINPKGKVVVNLPDHHEFTPEAEFHGGIAPIIIYEEQEQPKYPRNRGLLTQVHRYIPPIRHDGFVTIKGKIISDEAEVKRLKKEYEAKRKLAHPDENPLDSCPYVWYCSDISYLGENITLKANSPEELVELKRKAFTEIAGIIENLSSQVTSNLELMRVKPESKK